MCVRLLACALSPDTPPLPPGGHTARHRLSPQRQRIALGERLAVNTVLQGSAADLIKRAMIHIHRRIQKENRPSRLLIQVHDELVCAVPRSAVEEEAEMIRHEMITAIPLDVPITVDVAWGDNWLEGK